MIFKWKRLKQIMRVGGPSSFQTNISERRKHLYLTLSDPDVSGRHFLNKKGARRSKNMTPRPSSRDQCCQLPATASATKLRCCCCDETATSLLRRSSKSCCARSQQQQATAVVPRRWAVSCRLNPPFRKCPCTPSVFPSFRIIGWNRAGTTNL